MKAVLISIQPKWCEKIAIGKKTIEVRKTKPSIQTPFKVLIYCTKDKRDAFNNHNANLFLSPKGWQTHSECNGKVIGEFVCDKVYKLFSFADDTLYDAVGFNQYLHLGTIEKETCLTQKELCNYGKGKPLYAWHISQLKIYDKPRELSEFVTARGKDYCDGCGVAWESCNGDYHCTQKHCDGYHLSRAPQSYMYVEEV